MTKRLTEQDLKKLFQWEHKIFRIFSAALLLIFIGITLPLAISVSVWFRPFLFLLGGGLLLSVVVLQFSAKCPNCGARLGVQVLPLVPDRCKTCGLDFPRTKGLDNELDN